MIIKPYLDDWRVSWLVSKVTMWKMSPWSFFKGPMLIGSKTFDKGQENNIKPYTPWKINMEPTNLNMRNAHGVCCWTTITTYAGWWHRSGSNCKFRMSTSFTLKSHKKAAGKDSIGEKTVENLIAVLETKLAELEKQISFKYGNQPKSQQMMRSPAPTQKR